MRDKRIKAVIKGQCDSNQDPLSMNNKRKLNV